MKFTQLSDYLRTFSLGNAWKEFKTVFCSNYCNFSGKASVAEYWGFTIISLVLSFIFAFLFILAPFWFLAIILPSLAVTVRRLRSTEYPVILFILTFLGPLSILLLVLCSTDAVDTEASNPSQNDNKPYLK